jgi:hypothetical protein
MLLVQIRTEDYARQCDEAPKIRQRLKTASNFDVEKSQQSTSPLMQPPVQDGLAKCCKRVGSRALHASRSPFDVAEAERLFNPLFDRCRGIQAALARAKPSFGDQLPETLFAQGDAGCGQQLRNQRILDDVMRQ